MTAADLLSDLAGLERTLTSIESVLDPDAKRAEIAQLSEEVAAPDLWDDQENAQRVTSQLSRLQAEVDRLAKDDQNTLVARHGGREAALAVGKIGATPVPAAGRGGGA